MRHQPYGQAVNSNKKTDRLCGLLFQSCGFNYFLGYGLEGVSYTYIDPNYVRQGRVMVTGYNLSANPDWFAELFQPAEVLESSIR